MQKVLGTALLGFIAVTMLLINGCANQTTINDEVKGIEAATYKSEVVAKEMVTLGAVKSAKSEDEGKGDEESKEKIKDVDQEKTTTEKPSQAYESEKMAGDFMATNDLNIREGPGITYQSVGSLKPYAKATAIEKTTLAGDTWYKITSNGVTGWSSAKHLITYQKKEEPSKQAAQQPSKQVNKGTAQQPAKQPAKEPAQKPDKQPVQNTVTSVSPSAIEKAVIDLTNAERKKAGLPALKIDNGVVASARAKSNDMATNGYFSHTSPTYGSVGQQLKQFGVSFSGWGENIAKGHTSAEAVVNGWMNSPGHKANILHAGMTHIGVGYDGNGHLWTQQFIRK